MAKTTKEASAKKVEASKKVPAGTELPQEEVSNVDREALKAALREELKEEMKQEAIDEMTTTQEVVKVMFKKSLVARSDFFAEKLNARPKVLAVWETDEGQKAGYIEEVKIMGAVAQVPKGVPVLVPDEVAKMFKGYRRAEETAGDDLENQRGGKGVRADRDEATKEALNL